MISRMMLFTLFHYNQPAIIGNHRFMNAAKRPIPATSSSLQPLPQFIQPVEPRRSYQPKRVPFVGARRAIAFESSVKLTVNLLLAVIASTTVAKLVPYYQAQQERLGILQESVVQAEEKNAELRAQFGRNFDPAQASRIMQEQSGMGYPNQKKVIWTKPLD
ncbi:MAG: hypothetical protein WA949_02895 [Phormidesmis sp.]